MAYPAGAVKLQIAGSSLSVQSVSTGIEFMLLTPGTPVSQEELQDWLTTSVSPAVVTWAVAINGVTSQQVIWKTIRANAYNATGLEAVAEAALPSYDHGAAGVHVPPRVSLVVSKLTGIPSRNARGRMYIPALGSTPVNTTGRVPAADVTTVLNATKALYTTLDATTLAGSALIASVLSPTTATATPIASLRIDDLYDTQMRREDKFQPNYQSANL